MDAAEREEKIVRAIEGFLKARRVLLELWGDKYDEKIGPWREAVRAIAAAHSCSFAQVPLIEPKPIGFEAVWLLAACAEEMMSKEPTP